MELHEKVCFRNPNRFCELCKNKGSYRECYGDYIYEGDCGLGQDVDCPYCSKFDKKMLEEIEAREEGEEKPEPIKNIKVPF